jgi:hypothetical protein
MYSTETRPLPTSKTIQRERLRLLEGQALQVSHPFVTSKLLLGLAQIYEHEASREDIEAGIRRRLR